MKKRYYTIIVLLIGAHLLTELHTLIMWASPKSVNYIVSGWFIKPGFSVPDLNILWYFKMIEDGMLLTSILYAGACQAYSINYENYLQWQRYSFRLYLVWLIYFAYHVFDLSMFIYNYKTSYILYMCVLTVSTISAMLIGFSNKKHIFKQ